MITRDANGRFAKKIKKSSLKEFNIATSFIKILDKEGNSIHGGTFKWSLPKNGKPGNWAPKTTPLLCQSGYHLTMNPFLWAREMSSKSKNQIKDRDFYLVEGMGQGEEDYDNTKTAFEQARLIRLLTQDELIQYGIYTGVGYFDVPSTTKECMVIGNKNLTVRVSGKTKLFAYGNSIIKASGQATIHIFDNTQAIITDEVIAIAHNNSQIQFDGKVKITVYNKASATTNTWCHTETHIQAYSESVVNIPYNFYGLINLSHTSIVKINGYNRPTEIKCKGVVFRFKMNA